MKKYAIVGLGHRSSMFTTAILGRFSKEASLVGLCDTNQTRMDYYNGVFAAEYGAPAIPTYRAEAFDRMIAEGKPDVVIVTSMDRTHDEYINRAMRLGCDIITEKPLTIDAEKCQSIIDCQKETGKKVTVTFNYRYSPHSSKVKELLQRGAIGQILSVHFEWLLDTRHGADYFRRWHRDKANNGGLMVHKSTHHFDLINWWLASAPETVFGFGRRAFYGKANAEARGQTNTYARAYGEPAADHDPFAIHLEKDARLKGLYLNAEHEDGYFRDQGVFGDGISTEDDYALAVRYASGATMTYHLNAYAPWEGLRVMFNGTRGRLELEWVESAFNTLDDGGTVEDAYAREFGLTAAPVVQRVMDPTITLQPLWGKPLRVPLGAYSKGGHGGGDERLLSDLFSGQPEADPLGRAAGLHDGVVSLLTGIAANKSFASGQPVRADQL
ncbi:MAG TPA: Gfo/Idh/MocA family oxidoreductase, partial [Thermoflexales bacterium]|nr:Gfo/Idh/MocA family oxidoreductase [Thermoflexales bacterium]